VYGWYFDNFELLQGSGMFIQDAAFARTLASEPRHIFEIY